MGCHTPRPCPPGTIRSSARLRQPEKCKDRGRVPRCGIPRGPRGDLRGARSTAERGPHPPRPRFPTPICPPCPTTTPFPRAKSHPWRPQPGLPAWTSAWQPPPGPVLALKARPRRPPLARERRRRPWRRPQLALAKASARSRPSLLGRSASSAPPTEERRLGAGSGTEPASSSAVLFQGFGRRQRQLLDFPCSPAGGLRTID